MADPKMQFPDGENIITPEDEKLFQKIREGNFSNEDTKKITTITEEIAEIIIKKEGEFISLDGLKSLSDQVAKILAKYEGYIEFENLSSLSDSAAEDFSRQKGTIYFGSLNLAGLTNKAAKFLSEHERKLFIDSKRTEIYINSLKNK